MRVALISFLSLPVRTSGFFVEVFAGSRPTASLYRILNIHTLDFFVTFKVQIMAEVSLGSLGEAYITFCEIFRLRYGLSMAFANCATNH